MGLLDQVLGQVLGGGMGGGGMMGGGRGTPQPTPQAGGLGGMLSGAKGPIAMAILALLAQKHLKGGAGGYGSSLRDMLGGGSGAPGGASSGGGLLGSLGGLLGGGGAPGGMGGSTGGGMGSGMGGLGGALGGGMLGGALGGGLNDLLDRFRQNGHGEAAESWVGTGPNQRLSPEELERALGPEEIDHLSQETGMGRDDLLSGLSDTLPDVVDRLTPHGRRPTEDDAAQWV